jgi:predicted GNAT family acetyltransferase
MQETDKKRKLNILSLMKANPQLWSINAIVNHGYGEILFDNKDLAVLRISNFYFIEGIFDEKIAVRILEEISEDSYISTTSLQWKNYFSFCEKLNAVVMERVLYKWSGEADFKAADHLNINKDRYLIKEIEHNEVLQIEGMEWSNGVFNSYPDIENYLQNGMGFCVKDGDCIVVLCTSFALSDYGIEIEVDTNPEYQRQGLAKAACAVFIERALQKKLIPLWDSSNEASSKLAKSLGFECDKSYTALYVSKAEVLPE